ncbi:MAG TPA: hypothetical protein VF552_14000 [Allosphingosinicella sp.]|jgi:hypothetical protein
MMRWLDGLGPLKWPSLLLVAAPVAAYPYWNPALPPSTDCGIVGIKDQAFRAYRSADGSTFTLRPLARPADTAPRLVDVEPIAFDTGGMVVDAKQVLRAVRCPG